jgi:Xaa-Pro dipeptidase
MDHEQRIRGLQNQIKEQGLGGVFLSYSRDVFYYTGTAQPAYLFVLPDDYRLFVKSGFDFAIEEVFIDKNRMTEERSLQEIWKEVQPRLKGTRIGTELDVIPVNQLRALENILSGFELVDATPVVLEQRKRKDASEIEMIKKACEVVDNGHRAVLSTLKDGVTELELSAAIENAHRLAGHEGIFFIRQPDFFMGMGPISSGPNLLRPSGVVYTITGVGLSPAVPAGPSRRKIQKGDPVMVDIPVLVNGYHADQTRTYTVGRATDETKAMHDMLKTIADHLIEGIKPGMRCSRIFQVAVEKSEKLGVADAFMNFGRGRRSHIIGHGVGLELNEPPILSPYDDSRVAEGHVIALDMHMLRENEGVVKLEDMVLVKSDGNEILNKTDRVLFEVG